MFSEAGCILGNIPLCPSLMEEALFTLLPTVTWKANKLWMETGTALELREWETTLAGPG